MGQEKQKLEVRNKKQEKPFDKLRVTGWCHGEPVEP